MPAARNYWTLSALHPRLQCANWCSQRGCKCSTIAGNAQAPSYSVNACTTMYKQMQLLPWLLVLQCTCCCCCLRARSLAVPHRLIALVLCHHCFALVAVCDLVIAHTHNQVCIGKPACPGSAVEPAVLLPDHLQQLSTAYLRFLRLFQCTTMPKVKHVENACIQTRCHEHAIQCRQNALRRLCQESCTMLVAGSLCPAVMGSSVGMLLSHF